MMETLNRKDVSNSLDTSKEGVALMLQEADFEAAVKAWEQFPQFTKLALEVMTEYKEVLNRIIDGNSESAKRVYDIYDEIILVLKANLDKDNLSFEEKKYCIDKMFEIAKMAEKKDSENKQFSLENLGLGVAIIGVVILSVSVLILGGKNTKKDLT